MKERAPLLPPRADGSFPWVAVDGDGSPDQGVGRPELPRPPGFVPVSREGRCVLAGVGPDQPPMPANQLDVDRQVGGGLSLPPQDELAPGVPGPPPLEAGVDHLVARAELHAAGAAYGSAPVLVADLVALAPDNLQLPDHLLGPGQVLRTQAPVGTGADDDPDRREAGRPNGVIFHCAPPENGRPLS